MRQLQVFKEDLHKFFFGQRKDEVVLTLATVVVYVATAATSTALGR